jgi:pyruvate dehydrogenase phosphatase
MGGTRRGLFLGVLGTPAPLGRNAVDDTTILVVFFDELGGEGEIKEVAKTTTERKKRWWMPW